MTAIDDDPRLRAIAARLDAIEGEVAALRALLLQPEAPTALPATTATTGAPPTAPPPAVTPAAASRAEVIAALFEAALDPDEARGFERCEALLHSSLREAPHAGRSFRAFEWQRLRRSTDQYLSTPTDPTSFLVDREAPLEPGEAPRRVKLFLRSPGRSPVPLGLEQDPRCGDAWRLSTSSL